VRDKPFIKAASKISGLRGDALKGLKAIGSKRGGIMRGLKMLLSASALATVATPALAQDIVFKPIVEARLRYEMVEQDGPLPLVEDREANAVTMRLRAGGELSSGPFALLVEGEGTLAINEDYNSGVNGKTLYPIVADPENVEANRVQIQYRTKPLIVTLGRQRINLDDQRFVGSVARTIWGIDGGKFGSVNRPTEIDGDNVFANVSYKTKFGTLTGFAYLVDEDEPVAALLRNSSQTYGARFVGALPLAKKVKLSYLASYARQSDYAKNPVDYKADYVAAELGLEVWFRFHHAGQRHGLRVSDALCHAAQVQRLGGQVPDDAYHWHSGLLWRHRLYRAEGWQDGAAGRVLHLPPLQQRPALDPLWR
jgi:hypothetical protein